MIEIEVKSSHVETRTVRPRNGDPFDVYEQEAYARTYGPDGKPRPYPERIRIALESTSSPWPVGTYILHPASLYVNRFGDLSISRQIRLMKKSDLKAA
ncbi:hypothetical protein MIN45_P1890 [Methylomarinovum tepidoasis]|uniref:Single-stranded DNA-binding protein n=1 Tax=Methylomarinovum tepidoasis TaxID=2840183 RepID=A0AAU9C7C7_9GAMM|nr:single-stranded DNA-binding protein [Methylomarinovum sp. IN45]BCX89517.1 hypothetical protein MIN45_P1890 [Methylomarinovum sp. IN45]